jgi:type I restriction enzyme M protein
MNDDRFSAYGLAPSSKADFAFVQHMNFTSWTITELYFSHGALFRGGAEGHI